MSNSLFWPLNYKVVLPSPLSLSTLSPIPNSCSSIPSGNPKSSTGYVEILVSHDNLCSYTFAFAIAAPVSHLFDLVMKFTACLYFSQNPQ